MSWKLKIPPNLDNYWEENMGSKVSCTIYFEAYLFSTIRTNNDSGLQNLPSLPVVILKDLIR
ncbi:MAG: AAA-like domain-containing protein [Planktothrix agardhii KL2]|nr:AAA-like domain-containing protein [Planktothrix agardhii KL2]MCB8751661.1 AAA-like domain-containing protein [Planktothrix agardhii 1810]MCB8760643.1 AAA-like domain-containing protein [Planktothrix agardhii 1813]MCB8762571.1 AAA-like domain-containing protein [Planktothrix agardhii 1809]MCB8777202.1 AAA-like domain-containing protein [Planktothrix agardhii 1031]MCB8781627.1 AAA-like domain-containing protein [Planktothrix agardhii 1808]MCB8785918.1 AAA-like domain-containing protein [Pla